jgi:hypothetical protein
MDNSYENKYLKYKKKYLILKNLVAGSTRAEAEVIVKSKPTVLEAKDEVLKAERVASEAETVAAKELKLINDLKTLIKNVIQKENEVTEAFNKESGAIKRFLYKNDLKAKIEDAVKSCIEKQYKTKDEGTINRTKNSLEKIKQKFKDLNPSEKINEHTSDRTLHKAVYFVLYDDKKFTDEDIHKLNEARQAKLEANKARNILKNAINMELFKLGYGPKYDFNDMEAIF